MEEIRRIQPPDDTVSHHSHHKKSSWQVYVWWGVGTAVAVGVTVFVTLILVGVVNPGKWFRSLTAPLRQSQKIEIVAEDASDYWAVFLSNNQVYFGKLSASEGQYLRLKEVFYLRAQRQLQPPSEEDVSGTQPKQQIQLIKLGSELHGPVDEIQFNQDNVLFVERLKGDSRVVQGIEQYNSEKTNTLE